MKKQRAVEHAPARSTARGWLLRAAMRFVLVFAVGLLAWPAIAPPLSGMFVELARASYSGITFGRGGHVEFHDASARQHAAGESWSANATLRIDGVEQTHAVLLNPRRLAYLPALFFCACVAAPPLGLRRRAVCLAYGLPLVALSALASVWVIVAWIFARVPGLVYDLSRWQSIALEIAYQAFVAQIANKFIIPLAAAIALVLWQRSRELPTSPRGHAAHRW